ncbi:MAG: hypothetical protein F2602_04750 [Actinobacteria bacterium]|uniref:Unannotated protein n=1 Tax=freshwater metagenome TaxID=449393 RepID=A0A6J6IRC7_9ZZZZ|nr:hypothetical protein [Actinomycetota bacterium]MTA21707.1 hypothetical protein [Actinomycetota bacterium]
MKKLAVILLALSLIRVGVAYADTTTAQSDTFAAGQTSIVTDANQVLYFYKGADGKDGLNGVDGAQGADGAPGADGADGANGVNVATTSFTGALGGCTNGGVQVNAVDNVTYICNGSTGTGVISVLFTGSRGTCTNGGVQLTDSTGAVTYACNGSNGANGANGTNGTNGTGGTGSGATTEGQGVLSISSCESDTAITLNPVRLFDGEDFHFDQIQMGEASSTVGDIEATCAGKPVSFYLTIATGRSLISTAYTAGEILKCSATLPAANQWPGGSPWQFSFLSSSKWLALSTPASHQLRLRCYRAGGTGAELELNSVNTADYTNRIGFEIGN